MGSAVLQVSVEREPLELFSLDDVRVRMERRSDQAYVCPQTGLVYPVRHGVPIVLLDPELRMQCFYTAACMARDRAFDQPIPEPVRWPAEKRPIPFALGIAELLRHQLQDIAPRIHGALLEHLLRKGLGEPWRRPLSRVQSGYESWDTQRLFRYPNERHLGWSDGRFIRWNVAAFRERVTHELSGALAECGAARVLDVGCGYGMQLFHLAERLGPVAASLQLVGTDMTYSRVALAKRLHEQHNPAGRTGFFVGDARWLPYPDGYFDLGYSSHVLEVMPTKVMRHALLEMLRVCRRVLLFEPLLCVQSWWGWWYQLLFDVGGVRIDGLDSAAYSVRIARAGFDYKNETAIVRVERQER